jgi:hypothetical protein
MKYYQNLKISQKSVEPSLHPTTRLVLFVGVHDNSHVFSGHEKLCFIRDEKSNKDFWVDTGSTLSLIPFQSAAAAKGPKLQAINKQAIKTWNFVNTAVKFNGREYTFAFLRADGCAIPNRWPKFFEIFWDAG